jgi:hypothetical protein
LAEFDEDVLLVSVPFHRMFGIMRALDQGLGGEGTEMDEKAGRLAGGGYERPEGLQFAQGVE